MTHTTTRDDIIRMALEALQSISNCYVGDDDEAGECASCHERSYKPHALDCKKNNAITALKAALAQEHDAELSAALGWPGGISDPVLDRKTLLRKVAELNTPLTDEQIDRITDQQWASNNHKPIYAAHRAYARAIERAHGIGGQDEH